MCDRTFASVREERIAYFSILATTLFAIWMTVVCLERGISTVFPHLYYIPIVMSAYFYPRKCIPYIIGVVAVYVIACAHFGMFGADVAIRALVLCIMGGVTVLLTKQVLSREEEISGLVGEYATLINSTDEMLWILADPYTFGAMNRNAAMFFGFDVNAANGRKLLEIDIGEPPHSKIVAENIEVFATGKAVEVERWMRRKSDGERRLYRVRKTPKIDANGEVRYIVCTGVDITERRWVQEQSTIYIGKIVHRSVRRILESLGCLLDVDRASVFLNHRHPDTDDLTFGLWFDWSRDGVKVGFPAKDMNNVPYSVLGSRFYNTLSSGKCVCGKVSDFPMVEQELYDTHNILAVVAVPIIYRNKFYGFVAAADCHSERGWSQKEIDAVLSSVAIITALLDTMKALTPDTFTDVVGIRIYNGDGSGRP